ncbi:hypothetical protein TPR58_18025 [Sphingomonas sp. HF-S3]|uniref:DUF5348 domain-containing protein n=1 Tax=Sphingomonas rustica TaxID=3103142 RepID=A0ABV0BCV4_9SPHN
MSKDELVLRSYLGVVPSVSSLTCEGFFAFRRNIDFHIMYIRLSGSFHRFYFDDGELFWDEGGWPDADSELGEGEEYEDLTDIIKVRGRQIHYIENNNLVFRITFTDGYEFLFKYSVEHDAMQLQFFAL